MHLYVFYPVCRQLGTVPKLVDKLLDVFAVLHLTLVLALLRFQLLHHRVVKFSIVA